MAPDLLNLHLAGRFAVASRNTVAELLICPHVMFRFLPWKFIVQRAARAYGFADPALWLARIRNFAQPSEVQEPIELLRAGVLFHARGIVNAKAIQHNLDWVWPYWVERQFDPDDISFIPRAFSFSHINLTHRNWTAIGLPELSIYPIVDPRGLVTPLQDGWSIDFWLLDAGRQAARAEPACTTTMPASKMLAIDDRHVGRRPRRAWATCALQQSAQVIVQDGQPVVEIDVRASSPHGRLAGGGDSAVQSRGRAVHRSTLQARENGDGWRVNERLEVIADRPADQLVVVRLRQRRCVQPCCAVRMLTPQRRT